MPPEKKRFSAPWYVILIIIVGLILGGGAVYNQIALRGDMMAYFMPGKIPENGGGAHFYVTGEKSAVEQPAVLLLGGWGTASPVLDYMPLIQRLKGSAQVIAVERPGYGWASDKYSERTLDNMIAEMRAGIGDMKATGTYVIVAHTTAGLEAIHFAKRYPNEVAGIVFINALSPGAYFYQPNKYLDFVKALTYPVPKYTGIYRAIGIFKPELFATGPEVEPTEYAALYYKNIMSGAMFAELRTLSKNVKTALWDGDLEVPSVSFVDTKQYNNSNPELVRVWGEYFSNVIETDVGAYIHGFEPDKVASEVLKLVAEGQANYSEIIKNEPLEEPVEEPESTELDESETETESEAEAETETEPDESEVETPLDTEAETETPAEPEVSPPEIPEDLDESETDVF